MAIFSGVESSQKYQLSNEDLRKIGIGALIVVGGSLLTYLAETIPNIDFGVWTPVTVSIFSILINLGRKFLVEIK